MLTKAATHLRPLLRFPTHPTPDLFTPNPSLLHHLPQNGVGNSLISAAQQQAAGAGSGPGAAGAGRAGYQAGSGGYTGHARAFLSLPHTTADSTTASTSTDDRDRTQHRIRFHQPPPRPASTDLRSRTKPTVRLVEDEPIILTFPKARRKSIAWPDRAAVTDRVGTPQMSIRQLSTVPQPNRIQMDLAGYDPHSPRPTLRRRNSTAPITRQVESRDDAIAQAIQHAVEWSQKDHAKALIAHYRLPRDQSVRPSNIATQYPLPEGYSVSTYNMCLAATLSSRNRGDSIAPVLDMYNEMLARDLVPDARTYALVIHALTLREIDITSAWKRYEAERLWNEWRQAHLGIPNQTKPYAAESIEGYKAEANLDSALRLFETTTKLGEKYELATYKDLIDGCAISYRPRPEAAMNLFRQAQHNIQGWESLYPGLLRAGGDTEAIWSEYKGADGAVYIAAVRAFIAGGKIDRAMEILETMTEPLNDIVLDLAKYGHVDLALKWFETSLSRGYRITGAAAAELVDALALTGKVEAAVDILTASGVVSRARSMRTYAAVLASGNLEVLEKMSSVPLSFDAELINIHVNLLLNSGKHDKIAPLLDSIPPRPLNSAASLSKPLTAVINSNMPLSTLLDTIRAFARHRESLTPALAQTLMGRYMSEPRSSPVDLNLSADAWFRLLEASVMDQPDEVLHQLAIDLGTLRNSSAPLPEGLAFDAVANDFARVLMSRFNHDLVVVALGEKAPAPTATPLQLSPSLSSYIDRHTAPKTNVTPQAAYNRLKRELANNQAPHPTSLGKLIATFGRLGDEPRARELYALGGVIVSQLDAESWRVIEDSMLIACCFLGQLENAGLHRARLIEAGTHPSADAYATMIASSKDTTDDATVARELFEESQRFGVVPTLYLYNTIISKLSKARKAEMALELFKTMKASGVRPSSVTYGAVINACCRVGDAESAAALFEEMASMPNFKPRVPPFNTMMQFHLQTRPSREHVLHYYNAMIASNVRPSAHTYKLLLDAHGTLSPIDLPAMERAFSDLVNDPDVEIQGTHWASLITAYGIHAGDVDKALEVFNSIPGNQIGSATTADPVTWEAIITVLGARGTLDQVNDIVNRMKNANAGHTAYVSNALITAYASHHDLPSARAVFESMADPIVGVAAPNNHPQLLTSAGHVKPQTVTPQPIDIIFREPSSYECMIRAELIAGERARAEELLRRMEERRYPVAVYMKARALVEEPVI